MDGRSERPATGYGEPEAGTTVPRWQASHGRQGLPYFTKMPVAYQMPFGPRRRS